MNMINQTAPRRITDRDCSDPYSSGIIADLTSKQYHDLLEVTHLSPGYRFEVFRYNEDERCKGSSDTQIAIYIDGNPDYVGLVGRRVCDVYDGSEETMQVCRRVAGRVYRRTNIFFG